jgi:hypothetical protein
MATIMIVLVAGFMIGLMAGIVLGWSAAPAVVWRAPKKALEAEQAPQAVGLAGGLIASNRT